MRYLFIICAFALIAGCSGVGSDPVTVDGWYSYTAVGDDDMVGQANKVQLRVARTQDSLTDYWDDCTIVYDGATWPPFVYDTLPFQLTVTTGVPYYFGIKTADEIPNWSGLSNIVELTWADITAPSPILDLKVFK